MTTLDDIQQAAEGARCPDCRRLFATTAHEQTLAGRCNGTDSHGCLRHQVACARAGNEQMRLLLDLEKRYTAELALVATEAAAMLAEANHGGLTHERSVSMQAALEAAGVPIPPNCSACPHPGRDKRIAELEAALCAATARASELERELTEVLCFAPRCKQCGKACEPQRWVYAVPTCYSCLAPPEQLDLIAKGKTNGR